MINFDVNDYFSILFAFLDLNINHDLKARAHEVLQLIAEGLVPKLCLLNDVLGLHPFGGLGEPVAVFHAVATFFVEFECDVVAGLIDGICVVLSARVVDVVFGVGEECGSNFIFELEVFLV